MVILNGQTTVALPDGYRNGAAAAGNAGGPAQNEFRRS
jgi:hypothetical protein